MKGSDNDYPSILVVEQASKPTAPAAGKQRLYMKTDHKLYREDSGANESEIAGTGVVRSGATVNEHIALWNGANADSIKDGGALAPIYPWQIFVPHLFPSASSGSLNRNVDAVFSNSRLYTTAQNNYFEWPVLLCAGTWRLDFYYNSASDRAIATVTLDGSSIGTVDEYGGTASNVLGSITGIVVAATGIKLMRFAASTRNGSSSGWVMMAYMIALTRTGD